MKPARSPRFQSAAERTSIARISGCGSPSGTFGAEHAATASTRYHARRVERRCGMKSDWNAPRERLREMALTIQTALPRRVFDTGSRRPLLAPPFFFPPPFLALALGPALPAFFPAFGRDGFRPLL